VYEYFEIFDEQYIQNCKSMLVLQQQLIELKFVDLSFLIDFFDADKENSIKDIYSKYISYINKYEVTPNNKQVEFALACKKLLYK
jgi:hypothetical protein